MCNVLLNKSYYYRQIGYRQRCVYIIQKIIYKIIFKYCNICIWWFNKNSIPYNVWKSCRCGRSPKMHVTAPYQIDHQITRRNYYICVITAIIAEWMSYVINKCVQFVADYILYIYIIHIHIYIYIYKSMYIYWRDLYLEYTKNYISICSDYIIYKHELRDLNLVYTKISIRICFRLCYILEWPIFCANKKLYLLKKLY